MFSDSDYSPSGMPRIQVLLSDYRHRGLGAVPINVTSASPDRGDRRHLGMCLIERNRSETTGIDARFGQH